MIARHQHEHEAINAREYPGTRQLCATCDEPTGRCEDDSMCTVEGEGPLCVECYHKTPEYYQSAQCTSCHWEGSEADCVVEFHKNHNQSNPIERQCPSCGCDVE